MLTYLAIVEHLRPKWIVWENVPGVLSSGEGRDFGTFLGALGQLGYGFAYRVLDAQWVRTQRHSRAVPQRRRRVFVVGCVGDTASAAAVLFESESVQRHSPSRGAKGEDVAATIAARFGVSRNNYEECVSQKNTPVWPAVVASTLNAHFGDKLELEDQHALNGAPLFVGGNDVAPYQEVVGSLCARDHKAIGNQCVAQGKIVVAFTQNCREEVRDLNNVAGALAANEGSHQRTLLAYTKAKRAQSATDDESWVAGVVAPTQNAFDIGDTRATTAVVSQPMGVDLFNGTMTGDIHVPLRTAGGHGAPAVAIPIHDQATRFAGKNGDKFNGKGNGFGVGHNGDPSPTLTQGDKHAVGVIAFPLDLRNSQRDPEKHDAQNRQGLGVGSVGDPAHTVDASSVRGVAHAFYSTGGSHGLNTHAEISPTLMVGSSIGIPSPVAVAQAMTVRRLTPRECERLQGFPDDWTLVPWRRGMATDGNRYKAIGNSMAVNCMEWIGERIAQVDAR